MKRARLFVYGCVIAFYVLAAGAQAHAADVAGSSDYPLVGRYEGSEIFVYQKSDFDRVDLLNGALPAKFDDTTIPEDKRLRLEGRSFRIVYKAPHDRSALEIDANFAKSLKDKGFETLFSCVDRDCISGSSSLYRFGSLIDDTRRNFYYGDHVVYRLAVLKRPQGDVYVSILSGKGTEPVVAMRIAEVKPIEDDKIVFLDATAMKTSLDVSGHVALYGIYFDTDKSDLKAESAPTLAEIAKLLKSDPGLVLIVAGHTDNQGEFDYNVSLSQRRAASVATSLMRSYGIAKSRLIPFGAGMSAPVALNDAEAGRAKNRRVELVRR
ncbi:OmpA family protein [Xanthobacter sp.]|uniref:OmpA family protein n=1 Tax=Xanthobacter sp. TaxID=35809 RepID=UPI0035AEEF05